MGTTSIGLPPRGGVSRAIPDASAGATNRIPVSFRTVLLDRPFCSMIRRLLLFLGPVACGWGFWLFPAYAEVLEMALYGSLGTLLLCAPLLFARPTGAVASSTASAASDSPAAAGAAGAGRENGLSSLSRRLASVRPPSLTWGRAGWGLLALGGTAAMGWMIVSFVAMALDPAHAVAGSFHMLGSLFAVVLLAPLIVVLQPSSEPEDAVAATHPVEPAPEEADESTSFISSLFSGSDEEESSATEPAAEPYDESELRSIWPYAEEDAAREQSASGDGAADRSPKWPSEPASAPAEDTAASRSTTDATASFSATGSSATGSASNASPDGSASGASTGGWPWAEETQPAPSANESAEASHRSSSDANRAGEADTQWADSVWPPEDDSADSGESQASRSSSSSGGDTWPPANWPSLDDD